jgi:hypothetical protein
MRDKQDRHIDVIGVGTPPPLAIPPIVDEVVRILEQRSDDPAAGSTTEDPVHRRPDVPGRHSAGEAMPPPIPWT